MTKLSSSHQGKLSEALVISKLTSMGWTVSIPFSDASAYDLVTESTIGMVRLQIKTARLNKKPSLGGRTPIMIKTKPTTGKKYKPTDVDFILGVYQNKIYVVPVTDSLPSSNLQFSDKPNYRYSKGSCDIDVHPLFVRP